MKIQIEYYLSDENLEKDRFFHENISKDPEGFLEIDVLLNCNNLKKLAATKEDIVEAIRMSTILEMNNEKTRLRRVGNKKLPELKLLQNKRKASDADKDEKEEADDDNNMDNVILKVSVAGNTEVKWKTILEEFKNNNKGLNVIYIRFKESAGHIGVQAKRNQSITFTDKLKIDKDEFTIERCEGDDLINFWKEHGKHFQMCTEENNRKKGIKKRKDKKKQPSDRLKEPITLGGEKFTEVGKIKLRCRGILNLTKDGDKITGKDHEFLKDLLSNHKNGEVKLKDLDFFTTGQPKDFNHSRCFFITKTGGSSEDFSVHKCLEKFQN
jgi:hypothetical protein